MFWKKKMTTKSKKKLDQQLREVLAQQLIEKEAKLTEAEAENRKLKNEIEKIQEKFDKKEEQLEKNFEEMQKKLNEMEHKQNEQQKSNEQMEKMLQTKADAEKENDKLKNDHKQMEEKVYKLEEQLELKAFHEELEKKVMEQIDVTVQTKVDKMEMAQQQQKVVSEKAIFEQIGELEGQQKQQRENETKASDERFSQLQNDHKKLLEKISELEKEQKQLQKENIAAEECFSQLQNERKKLLEKINEMEKQQKEQSKATVNQSDQLSKIQNDQKILLQKISELEKRTQRKFQQNYWDANTCAANLEISGEKNLTVHLKGNFSGLYHSVFAKHSILLEKYSSNIFYYEISIGNKENFMFFGFAVKQQAKLNGTIRGCKGTYLYESDGDIWINGKGTRPNNEYSYDVGDTVGIGVNSATRQIIYTKNGLRLGFSNFFVAASFADGSLYPFVSLACAGNKIEANFGPNFKFDLTTL